MDEKQRSDFGRRLLEELLDATEDRKRITQRQIALRSSEIAKQSRRKEDEIATDELSRMITGEYIPSDSALLDKLSAIFKAIAAEREAPLSEDQVRVILAAREIQTRLNDKRQRELIDLLKKELIIVQRYLTSSGMQLLGREKDIAAVWSVILKEEVYLVTITGIPGVGKTELAKQIEEMAKTQRYFSYVCFIPVDAFTLMDDVLNAITKQLPVNKKETLLILDNCEQIEDAPETRKQFRVFLDNHKWLKVIATSRRPFHIGLAIEHIYQITPLTTPIKYQDEPLEKLQAYDAVKLFRQTAVKIDEQFTLTEQNIKTVVAICQALDGLPLALLIAASLVRYETVYRLYQWIEDNNMFTAKYDYAESEWHQSLDALITRSYDLLSDLDRTIFRRLAIFVCPCHIEVVHAVCGGKDSLLPMSHLSNTLRKLSDYHLVTYQNGLIAISHDVVHRFASRELEDKDNKKLIKQSYLDFYVELVAAYTKAKQEGNGNLETYQKILYEERLNISAVHTILSDGRLQRIREETKKRVSKEDYDAYLRVTERIDQEMKARGWKKQIYTTSTELDLHSKNLKQKIEELAAPAYNLEFYQLLFGRLKEQVYQGIVEHNGGFLALEEEEDILKHEYVLSTLLEASTESSDPVNIVAEYRYSGEAYGVSKMEVTIAAMGEWEEGMVTAMAEGKRRPRK